jgi:DNA-binding IclR family transcriptional regulator
LKSITGDLPSMNSNVPSGDRNRSLERGINILRTFKPGSDLLGNGEIAERTGLARATVSRLTQTLVDSGMLEHDSHHRAYRLAAPVLSLAHAMRSGSPVLQVAGPLMRQEAEQRKINVGLAVADRDEMVYLESVRYSRRVPWRNVVAGQRVPMELTSLGRAWLAAAAPALTQELIHLFQERRQTGWLALSREIQNAMRSVQTVGYCWASWQPQVVALATPIVMPGHPIYVLNMSVNTESAQQETVDRLAEPLKMLARQIQVAIEQQRPTL